MSVLHWPLLRGQTRRIDGAELDHAVKIELVIALTVHGGTEWQGHLFGVGQPHTIVRDVAVLMRHLVQVG